MRATAATAMAPITPISAVPIKLRAPARKPPTSPAIAPTSADHGEPGERGVGEHGDRISAHPAAGNGPDLGL